MSTRPELPIIHGTTATKVVLPCLVDDEGRLITTGGGGGGSITIADITEAIEEAVNIDVDLDAIASKLPSPYTDYAGDDVTIGTTSTVVLAANASRKKYFIWNSSNQDIEFEFSSPGTTAGAFVLYPGDVCYDDTIQVHRGAINAIAPEEVAISVREWE
jgi:hypothetical protein